MPPTMLQFTARGHQAPLYRLPEERAHTVPGSGVTLAAGLVTRAIGFDAGDLHRHLQTLSTRVR